MPDFTVTLYVQDSEKWPSILAFCPDVLALDLLALIYTIHYKVVILLCKRLYNPSR